VSLVSPFCQLTKLTHHITIQTDDDFFASFNELLRSENFVTKRQFLQMLDTLLYMYNKSIMLRYINEPANLKVVMNALRVNSKAVQLEAFQALKLFVANPNKAAPIVTVLCR
jgi:calcium binding protein 39